MPKIDLNCKVRVLCAHTIYATMSLSLLEPFGSLALKENYKACPSCSVNEGVGVTSNKSKPYTKIQ